VVLLNNGLRWARVVRGMRWLLCAVWVINPMTLIYATQGMSETPFIFFLVALLLTFLRWSESRRVALLPLMGVMAGFAILCREEGMLFALLVGMGVVVLSIRRASSWREIEAYLLLYALPGVFLAGLWIGSMTVLEHNPLYFANSSYSN